MKLEMVEATLNGEYKLLLPKHRAERPDWYTNEGWEKARLKSMHENINANDVVYYIGAELGEMAALCSLWGADVALFEPNHSAWNVIRATWQANKLKAPIYCFAGFCSNKDAIRPSHPDRNLHNGKGWEIQADGYPLYADEEFTVAHGFSELYQEADGLPQIKIDTVVAQGVKPPTVITFDCEGSDWEVMRGAAQTLKDYKPKIWASIHPEFMYHQYGQYSNDFRAWLKNFGYKEHILDYQHELHIYYEPIA